MFSWLGGSNGLSLNRQSQPRCTNFAALEVAVREARHRKRLETNAIKLHPNFEQLDHCARRGCTGCRVVRQALLLAQISNRQVEALEKGREPIHLQWRSGQETEAESPNISMATVFVGEPWDYVNCVDIPLAKNISHAMLPEKRFDLVVPQLKSWLDVCCQTHQAQCGNLSWSTENPQRLVEIRSDSVVRLLNTADLPLLQYVALSYCWGNGGNHANTTWMNLPSRMEGFSMQGLPATIRDALLLVRRLGLKYMWIDQLCIVQPTSDGPGEDWDLEGARMHIVYGNALFTLNACSSEASTDGLFRPRKAWTYPVVPCYFEGQWLTNPELALKDVRGRAPLSIRAWVLQEERLSPRLIYFCGQQFYWSCLVKQCTERATNDWVQGDLFSKLPVRASDYEWMSEAQAFLEVRFEGNKSKLHREWQDLVEAYCLRNMTRTTDRFRAISGLAAQYLRVHLNKDNRILGQAYLAGLWHATFAEDLAWSVQEAGDPEASLIDLAPSWSWASLPLCTRIRHRHPFTRSDGFEVLHALEDDAQGGSTSNDAAAVVLAACRTGAERRTAVVRSRLQKVMNRNFKRVAWSKVSTARHGEYSFSRFVDEHVYARNIEDGRIVMHEPTKRSIEGQLDYLAPEGKELPVNHQGEVYVALDAERNLWGLEFGQYTMLLLQLVSDSDQNDKENNPVAKHRKLPVFRRVGICCNVRDTYFDGVALTDLELR